ncbi:MAG TPA: SDR family oxidoreductase [Polyangiaceae bacterium]|nr:SDR family oxidoreductase [Polyangiaceae bacterium]
MTSLEDAVVVLTGAAGGIGRATTARLVERGAQVVAVDKDRPGLAALTRAHGGTVTSYDVDLGDLSRLDALATAVTEAHGPVDALVHNAGLTVQGEFRDMTTAQIQRVLDIDLRSPIELTRAFLPRLAESAQVVFVSSMSAIQPFPTQSTYSAAKAGLRAFAEVLRIESTTLGVSVVLPGTIATPFLENADTHDAKTTASLAELMLRFGTDPDRVAAAIVSAIERGRPVVRVGWDCYTVSAVRWLCPELLPRLLRRARRLRWLGRSRPARS